MILIADSGSTKTQWALASSLDDYESVSTAGINPFYQTADEITSNIKSQLLSELKSNKIEIIHFYGAGCSQADKKSKVMAALQVNFPDSSILIEHDLLGAARATCRSEEGITAILGTGSNSCLFDGEKIVDNIPSLGFILGDEAGGAYFGRQLLQSYFYRELPLDLREQLEQEFHMAKETVLNTVYDQPNPNHFVADFAKFLTEHADQPYFTLMLKAGFNDFIERHLLKYENHRTLPVHFIGSIAFHNKKILSDTLQQHDLITGRIIKSPMEGLLKFHLG